MHTHEAQAGKGKLNFLPSGVPGYFDTLICVAPLL